MVILKRFSDLVGYKFDVTDFDISKISMNYKIQQENHRLLESEKG